MRRNNCAAQLCPPSPLPRPHVSPLVLSPRLVLEFAGYLHGDLNLSSVGRAVGLDGTEYISSPDTWQASTQLPPLGPSALARAISQSTNSHCTAAFALRPLH